VNEVTDNVAGRLAFRARGEDVQIYPRAHSVSPEVISIGDSVIIDDFVFLVGGLETRIGSFVHLASFSSYVGRGRLVIEDFVSISSGARIYTGIDDFSGESLVGPAVPEPFRQPTRTFAHIGKYALVGPTPSSSGVTTVRDARSARSPSSTATVNPGRLRVSPPGPSRSAGVTASTSSSGSFGALYDGEGRYVPLDRK
jgi:galactoside O-acetyltransferase